MFNRKKSCQCSFNACLWVFHIVAVLAIGASLAYAYSDKFRRTANKIKNKAEDCIDSCCDM